MSSTQPTLARRALGARIRSLRETQGIQPVELAAAIGYTAKSIYRIESGTQGTKQVTIKEICRFLGVSDDERSYLCALVVRGAERGWWEPYIDAGEGTRPDFPLFLETEQIADRIRVLETEVVPGLLQTPEYLVELQSALLPMPDEVAESVRGLRTHRQKLLADRDDPPRMEFLIGRGAMHYLDELPSDVAMRQRQHLLDTAALPYADVRVITKLHAGAAGAFAILTPPEMTPFVYVDLMDGCRYIEDEDVVSMYEQTFTAARQKSVSIEEYLK